MTALHFAARHGRALLVLGLFAGATLSDLALVLRGWLPEFVAILLFLTSVRVGHKAVLSGLQDIRQTLGTVVILQMVAPLSVLAGLWVTFEQLHPFALAVVLMLAAPSVTGAPNFLIMMGREPSAALRLLVMGTLVFPLTVIPVLWALPALDMDSALRAAFRLVAVILYATGLGFAVRHFVFPKVSHTGLQSLDGLSAIFLAIIVVGLMSEIGPMLHSDPGNLLGWALAVLCLNFGLQIATYMFLKRLSWPGGDAVSVVAGNRNIALFLIALPPEFTGPLLVFIGCYQIPMYLTPLVMRQVYQSKSGLI